MAPCVPCSTAGNTHRGCQHFCGASTRCAEQRGRVRAHAVKGIETPVAPVEVGWLWNTKASRTKEQLAEFKARPKKALGQNFVTDENILQRIVEESGVQQGDLVLEIGPGTGNLTLSLLKAGATVLALEKDYNFAEKLQHAVGADKPLKVVQGDALRDNLLSLIDDLRAMQPPAAADSSDAPASDSAVAPLQTQARPHADGPRWGTWEANALDSRPQPPKPRRVKVVANLPYYITTEVLKLLLPLGEHVSHVAFMLQHEVALRLSDPHPSDGGQYRPMTVFSHFFSKPEYMFKIDRSSYFPSPEVHGALAVFTLLPPEEREAVRSVREFQSFVRQAFSSKRKMIANSLQPRWHKDDISAAVAALSLSAKVRPQELSSIQFVELYRELCRLEEDSTVAADVAMNADAVDALARELPVADAAVPATEVTVPDDADSVSADDFVYLT